MAPAEHLRARRLPADGPKSRLLVVVSALLWAVACSRKEQPSTLKWEACDGGQCATLNVPTNYARPNGAKLELELFRAPARRGKARGVLVYLPGGPGVPVLRFATELRTSLAKHFPQLDIVLMDPRGVGESAAIDCMGPEFLKYGSPVNTSIAPKDDVRRETERLSKFWKSFEARCLAEMGKETLAGYHSENLARDLEQVRKALGEKRLNLWAASYATVAAAIYAKIFPEHVGRFLLSQPTFRGTSHRIDDTKAILAAHEREFARVLTWCAEENRCGLGASAAEVRKAYDALRAQLRAGVTVDGKAIRPVALTLAVTIWLGEGAWDRIAQALRDASGGNWRRVAQRAQTDPYFEEEPDQLAYWQATTVLQLLDFGCPSDYSVDRAASDIEAALKAYPLSAEVFVPEIVPCASWRTVASEPRVVPNRVNAPPMLLLAGKHDPYTPLSGARSLHAQLGNESELVVADVEGHLALSLSDPLNREAVRFIARDAR